MARSSTPDRSFRPVLPVLLLTLLLAVGAAFPATLRAAVAWPRSLDGVASALLDATLPDATLPDAAVPTVTQPTVTQPTASRPESTRPESTRPESTQPIATLWNAAAPSSVTDVSDRDGQTPARVRPGQRSGDTDASMPGGALVLPLNVLFFALLLLGLAGTVQPHRDTRDGTPVRGRGPPRQRFDLVS